MALTPVHVGRPPFDLKAERQQCRGKTGLYEDRPCESNGSWLLPDVPYCARHLPVEYIPVVLKRKEAWIAAGKQVWEEIVQQHPIELRPEDRSEQPAKKNRR
jgi:hypothetical protein